MAFVFVEIPDSRLQNRDSYVMRFKAAGEQDDALVVSYAASATALVVFTPYGTFYRQDILVQPDGWAQYVVTVPYGPMQRAVGSYSFSFDTTGGTVNIKAGKEHVKSYNIIGEVVSDFHKGAINVNEDGRAEGVEIVIPALRFSVNYRHPQGIVTLDYMRQLSEATGKTNDAEFLGFAAGELLFMGATGSDGTEAEAEVTYHFVASPNAEDGLVGGIAVAEKLGHDYGWIQTKSEVEDGRAVTQPEFVHIERVYDEEDFPTVLGWS